MSFDEEYVEDGEAYFIGPCTCDHDEGEHGWGACDVDGCECEAGWEE